MYSLDRVLLRAMASAHALAPSGAISIVSHVTSSSRGFRSMSASSTAQPSGTDRVRKVTERRVGCCCTKWERAAMLAERHPNGIRYPQMLLLLSTSCLTICRASFW